MKYRIISLLNFAFSLSIGLLGQTNIDWSDEIKTYNEHGYKYLINGNYDSAEFYLKKTLELQEAKIGKKKPEIAYTHINLGVLYRNIYNFKQALFHFKTAEEYFLEYEPNSIYLGYCYTNKGNIYYNYIDYREAELYYRYSMDFFESIGETNINAYHQTSINLFNILVAQKRYNEALKFIDTQKTIVYEGATSFNRHMFIAEAYSRLYNYEAALDELKLARVAYELLPEENYPSLMRYYYRLASIHVQLGNYDQAQDYLLNNLKISFDEGPVFYEELFETYLLIGNIHYLKGNYSDCLSWLRSSLKKIDLYSKSADGSVNDSDYNKTIIDFYRLYGNAAQKLYYITNNTEDLIASLEYYNKCIDHIKKFKIHMRNEESAHLESEARIDIIHEAVYVAAKLYNETHEDKYLELAFLYAENMKSFSLFTEIKGEEAMQFSNLPTSIKNRESYLTQKMEAYSELINNERSKSDPDLNVITNLNTAYFKYKDNYNSLIDSIENLFPKYYDLKYNPHFITLDSLQKRIGKKEAIVEYVLSDTILTTFIIDKTQIKVLTQEIDPGFADDCYSYYTLLQKQDFDKNVHETFRIFVRLGRMFYETLVAPVLEVTKSREITFVPDGEIMYLPFETFVTEEVDREYIAYNQVPYLIYDVSVGYSYSSTLLFSERIRSKSPKEKVLAFAPSYDNLLDYKDPLEWNRQANPDLLMPLPGAREEVSYISKNVPSDIYFDDEASEANFKVQASDYSVLHLAMHTIMNDEDPMFSKLAFTRNWNDTTEDHNLYTYEIYNLDLNAEMVVLSSCSSGYGKMQKGEGMMSMSRGFIYAGCPSIVMTLWQISDRSSAELMSKFYKHLKKGKSKKESLRNAKIEYIKSSDNLKANPYFWSAFLLVGDSAPLYGFGGKVQSVIIISVLSILLLIPFLLRKQFTGRSKKRR